MSTGLVDWELAASTGTRLVRSGPSCTPEQARAAVSELRHSAIEARGHVRACTGLDAPAIDAPVAVVDRATWVRSNVAGLRTLLEPLQDRLPAPNSAAARQATAKVSGLEVGAGLAFLAGKVLGQYEVFQPDGAPGRLLLVAPNIVAVERELEVDPSDFRLWVCLHEETHRVQFTAVPWLRAHLTAQVGEIAADLESLGKGGQGQPKDRMAAVLSAVSAALRGVPGPSLAEALQSPAQRDRLSSVTALMSLLEGHADVVMDEVGPAVVPTVAVIRARFQRRREQPGRVDGAVRRLLGFDAKLKQYADGAKFVRGVVDVVGMDGFNRVWDSPQTLPTVVELADPAGWVSRVHG